MSERKAIGNKIKITIIILKDNTEPVVKTCSHGELWYKYIII